MKYNKKNIGTTLAKEPAACIVQTGKTQPLRPEFNFNFQRARFKFWKESGLN